MTIVKSIGAILGGCAVAVAVMTAAFVITSPSSPGTYTDYPAPIEQPVFVPGKPEAPVYDLGPPEYLPPATGGDVNGTLSFGDDRYAAYQFWGVEIVINVTKALLALGMLVGGVLLGVCFGYRKWGADVLANDGR